MKRHTLTSGLRSHTQQIVVHITCSRYIQMAHRYDSSAC